MPIIILMAALLALGIHLAREVVAPAFAWDADMFTAFLVVFYSICLIAGFKLKKGKSL